MTSYGSVGSDLEGQTREADAPAKRRRGLVILGLALGCAENFLATAQRRGPTLGPAAMRS